MILALALLVVGGMALVNALTGDADKEPGPTGAAPSDSADTASVSPRRSTQAASAAIPLLVRVVGPPTNVVVKVSDTGEIAAQGVLQTGDTRTFREAPLNLVVNNGSSVQVTIYGKLQRARGPGRATWFVDQR